MFHKRDYADASQIMSIVQLVASACLIALMDQRSHGSSLSWISALMDHRSHGSAYFDMKIRETLTYRA